MGLLHVGHVCFKHFVDGGCVRNVAGRLQISKTCWGDGTTIGRAPLTPLQRQDKKTSTRCTKDLCVCVDVIDATRVETECSRRVRFGQMSIEHECFL